MHGDVVMTMKHAVYSGSRNVYGDMVASAKSLAAHSDVDRIWFLIEDPEFPFDLPDYVTCIDVSSQGFFAADGPNMASGYTYLAMMRAALCHVLPDVDRVLSLDCDTVCVGDVSDLWDIDLEGCYFAASREPHRCYCDVLYTNTGVCLYNLDMLRDGKADEVISVLNSKRFKYVEQDVMNCLCQGRIAEMDGNYNANDWTEHDSPRILHFAGHSDWRGRPEIAMYRDMAWDDVRKPRVFIAVPLADKADPSVFKAIWDMDKPCPCSFDYVKGYVTDRARNEIARKAMDGGYTHVLMVDSDVIVPKDALANLLEGGCGVVLGCYPRKNTSTGQSELFSDGRDYTDENNIPYQSLPDGRLSIKGGGMGCALISVDVFRRIGFPWFDYVMYPNGNVLSEDLSFCSKCGDAGIDIEADARVRCGHIGSRVQYM